jgi:hypothetical protein
VEKRGYRGKLYSNTFLAALHGWNGHDYRNSDLAAFFNEARRENFPLNREELILEDMLLKNGVIVKNSDGSFKAGRGAIVGVSRESPGYLRRQFMVHECYHGIYFVDAGLRSFTKSQWDKLDPSAKKFFKAYMAFDGYDPNDSYLMVNEFMAYNLERSSSLVGKYLGNTCACRLLGSAWAGGLPLNDPEDGPWPDLVSTFNATSKAFSNFVNRRWGLDAGRNGFAAVSK